MSHDLAKAEMPSPPASKGILFVSLGMLVLDELSFPDGTVIHDVVGGSGLYSTLGARMTTKGAEIPSRVGCHVLAGRDFPNAVVKTLQEWNMTLSIVRDQIKLSTRGLLRYEGENFKDRIFSYTTLPLQPTPSSLEGSPLLHSAAFHFLASPALLLDFVSQLANLRPRQAEDQSRALMVWEPAPFSCTHDLCDAHLEAAKLVDVYSPNHKELLYTLVPDAAEDASAREFDRATVEEQALRVVESGVGNGGQGTVIVRCAEHGSFVVSRSFPPRWFPAFHEGDSTHVVDATGAGNAFLGGFTVTFAESEDVTEATIAGVIAASFVIEQIGPPRLGHEGGKETWNGEEFSARVERYRSRMV